MEVCSGCVTEGDARRRHATTGNVTTSQQTRGKWEERRQRTRGDGASIGQRCALRGRGRVKRMRGGGINATTSHQKRDYHSGGKSGSDGDGGRECRALPSQDLVATALVLAAEAAAVLIADNADQ